MKEKKNSKTVSLCVGKKKATPGSVVKESFHSSSQASQLPTHVDASVFSLSLLSTNNSRFSFIGEPSTRERV